MPALAVAIVVVVLLNGSFSFAQEYRADRAAARLTAAYRAARSRAMFTHILVPLDGSPLAQSALPSALALASATDASITLLSVVPPAQMFPDYYIPYNAAMEAAQLAAAGNALEEGRDLVDMDARGLDPQQVLEGQGVPPLLQR